MMKNTFLFILTLISIFLLTACMEQQEQNQTRQVSFENPDISYPEVFQDSSIVDDYHGTKIADPYRWLEDDDSEETKAWVDAQNEVTFGHLSEIPYREALQNRLKELWDYERYSVPFRKGGHYYFFKNDGLQNQSVMYEQESLEGEASVVLDPNKFSEDGTSSLAGYSFSENGRYLAYQVSEGGSDWRTAYVKDLQTGEVLSDKLEWLKFTGTPWHEDGFFYSRYPEPDEEGEALSGKNEFQQVYYHKLGTPQEDDQLIFADRSNPKRGFSTQVTEDERFLIMYIWESTSGNALFFKDLKLANGDFYPLVETVDHDFSVIDNLGDRLLVLTNYKATNQRLLAIDTQNPEESNWKEVIPETDDVLESVTIAGGKLIAQYLHDAYSQAKVFDLEGKYLADIPLPGIGSVGSFSGKKEDETAFFSFTSFTTPSTIYQLDMESLEAKVFRSPTLDFDGSKYITKQVWFESKDGTRVPMFITHKKGLKLDGKRPTLLYGYGGFNINLTPGFSLTRSIVLENGGVYAVPNLRGGGEFGSDWHKAGTLERKQNVFDDFISAAEYLIANDYTNSDKLAIQGGSNGGLLVGACMTQRPDLYAVAMPAVGVLDMLRYHLFTIGAAWATDYGLSSDPEAFKYLIAYSPLHNLKPADYPATLVTTADHDDRVVPAHSFKFISELQKQQKGEEPVLIRVETSAGHGAGKPVSKQIEEAADWLGFMFYHLEEDVIYDYEVRD
jgi:prolyl oligopeptidase